MLQLSLHLFDCVFVGYIRVNSKSVLLQKLMHLPVILKRYAIRIAHIIEECIQLSLSSHLRIQVAQRSRRGITGVF
ncbi:hypothetical protein D3C78_1152300 [compost metagenome]